MRHLDRVVLIAATLALAVTLSGSIQGADLGQAARGDFHEPEVWASRGGVLQGVLEVKRAPGSLGRHPTLTLLYNGSLPGPTWRVKPGDRIQVRLINNATLSVAAVASAAGAASQGAPPTGAAHQHGHAAATELFSGGIVAPETADTLHTNIHTHGLQVDPRGNSDNPFVDIAPGQYFDYSIAIPANQPAGLFWYHPHRHMAVSRQLWNGMAGAIIVEGGLDTVPVVAAARERLLVINEMILDERGQVPAVMLVPTAGPVPFAGLPPAPEEIHFPVNGVLQPRIPIRPREIQRWRIVNASAHRVIKLALEDHRGRETPLHQIAQDGLNYGASIERSNILIAPGNRVEVLVQGGQAGTYLLKAQAYNQGHPGGDRPEIVLARVVSKGWVDTSTATFPVALIPPQQDAIAGPPPANPPDLPMAWSGQIMTKPISFELDGHQFDPGRVDRAPTVGTWEEWTLDNHDVYHHPFHIHVNPFQVVKLNGADYPESFVWWDVFPLPPRGSATVRMFFRPDIAGKTLYHCHIIPHEDAGMMGVVALTPFVDVPPAGPFAHGPVPPPGKPKVARLDRPYVFTQLANGGTATVPRGRAVALQLPGDPTTWRVTVDGGAVIPTSTDFIPSQGQFDGANGIYVFNFRMARSGQATISAVQTSHPLDWLGAFRLTLTTVALPLAAAPGGPAAFPLLQSPARLAALGLPAVHSRSLFGGSRGMDISVRQVPASPAKP